MSKPQAVDVKAVAQVKVAVTTSKGDDIAGVLPAFRSLFHRRGWHAAVQGSNNVMEN